MHFYVDTCAVFNAYYTYKQQGLRKYARISAVRLSREETMPTYEYACDTCGNAFEAVQKMADAPLTECPKCGKKIHRVLSGGIGISFKGSGFYANDSHSCPANDSAPKKTACESGGCKECSKNSA